MISQVARIFNTHARGIAATPAMTPTMTPSMTTPDNGPNTLDLLVPWDIPLECSLDDIEKQQIQTLLQQLLQTLQLDDSLQTIAQTEQLLATLPIPNTQPARVKSTKTSLSTDDVDDYDQYFGINHVKTDETAICLVRGLVVNCYQFMVLCHQNPQLSPKQINQQKQGFISYIHLLARVFYLEDLL